MKKILVSALALSAVSAFAADANPTLEQRVSELETASYLQAIQWNGSFEYRYDSINDEEGTTKASYSPMRLRVLLDAATHVDPKIQFYTRFGLTKFTNDMSNGSGEANTFSATRNEKGVALSLERAYVNYAITKDVVASAGRLPTIDGSPIDMWDNTPRQGTYPMLAYGAILDGLALSYNWGFLPDQYKFSTRFIYTPLYNVSSDSTLLGNISTPTLGGFTGGALQEKATMYSVMADFSTKAVPMISDFSLVGQAVVSKDIHLADGVARGTNLNAALANPALGGTGIPTGDAGRQYDFTGSTLRFNIQNLVANTTLNNIANSNVSIGFSYLHTKIESKGYQETNTAINTVVAGSKGAAAAAALAKKLGIGKGVMTDSADDKIQGSTILVTATYITPFTSIKSPQIGGEYVHGTKNVQYWGGYTADNLTSFYATRGSGYHAFISQPLAAGVNVRIGYMKQDHEFSKGYVGAPVASTLKENTVYGNFRYTF
ncbi:MAG: DUF3373 family protein [Bacteriovorax sp.]|nr:DUF3373 family protein [Bacteriovorax sp.]